MVKTGRVLQIIIKGLQVSLSCLREVLFPFYSLRQGIESASLTCNNLIAGVNFIISIYLLRCKKKIFLNQDLYKKLFLRQVKITLESREILLRGFCYRAKRNLRSQCKVFFHAKSSQKTFLGYITSCLKNISEMV